MDKWLNRLTNVAMIIVAIAAVIVVARSPRTSVFTAQPAAAAYKAGDRLDVSRLPLKNSTLVIVTRSTCPYCTASMEFYKTLKNLPVIWVATGESTVTNKQYLQSNGILPEFVLDRKEAGLERVQGIPTILLVNSDGRIVKSWEGKLEEDEEREVLTEIKKGI